MKFQQGAISLNDISGGTLASGVIPFGRFERDFQQAENAGNVTVLATATDIATLTITGGVVGDRVLAFARYKATKGGTGGHVRVEIRRNAGPGNLIWMLEGGTATREFDPVPASQVWEIGMAVVGVITVDGAIDLELRALSAGSDSTCFAGAGGFSAWLIAGS